MPVKTRQQKKPISHVETTWGPVAPDSPPSTMRYPRDSSLPLASPPNPRPLRIRQLQATQTPQLVGSPVLPRTVRSVVQHQGRASPARNSGRVVARGGVSKCCVSPRTPQNSRSSRTISPCVGSNGGRALSPVRSRFSSQTDAAKAKQQEVGEGLPLKRRVTRQTPQQPQAKSRLLLSPRYRGLAKGLASTILEQPNTPQNVAPASTYRPPARRSRVA